MNTSKEFGFGSCNNGRCVYNQRTNNNITTNNINNNNNNINIDDDDVDVLLKSIYYYDPKELAQQISIKLFTMTAATTTEQQHERYYYNHNDVGGDDDGTGYYPSRNNNIDDDPLTRYYEIKEHLNVFMWTLEDIMLKEEAQREEYKLNPLFSSSSTSSIRTTAATTTTSVEQSPSYEERTTSSSEQHPHPYDVSDHNHYPYTSELMNLPEEEQEYYQLQEEEPLQYPPLECIRRISESGYLTSKELGRLLLLTTPKMIQQLTNDFVWTCLCQARFGPNIFMSSSLLSTLLPITTTTTTKTKSKCMKSNNNNNQNHQRQDNQKEWLFRQLSKGIKPQPSFTTTPLSSSEIWPTIEPSNLQSRDLQLLLSWYPNKHQARNDGLPPITTLSITGRRLNEFLQRGQVTIPVKGGGVNMIPAPSPQNIDQTYVCIHAIRRLRHNNNNNNNNNSGHNRNGDIDLGGCDDSSTMNDQYQTVCIHETEEYSYDAANNSTNSNLFVDSSVHHGDLYLGPNVPILLKQSGKDLETRLARGDHEPGGFEILVIGHVSSDTVVATSTTSNTNTTAPTTTTPAIDNNATASRIGDDDDNHDYISLNGTFDGEDIMNSDGIDNENNNHNRQQQQQQQTQQQQQRIIKTISLQFWANYSDRLYIYNSREESQKHGVTLLHILDQLDGWT